MSKLCSSFILSLALLATAAQAKNPGTSTGTDDSAKYAICSGRDSYAAAMDCYGREYDRLKKLLDAAYKQLISLSDPDLRPFLVASQDKWSAYREAECSYVDQEAGGQLGYEIGSGCDLEMLAKRIEELNGYIAFERKWAITPRKAKPAK
jgi:uncharacterized protein YecT (DUF1311 family)